VLTLQQKKGYVTADTSSQIKQHEMPKYHYQEEADTIIILHAAKMSKKINLFVDSPDTDVALLFKKSPRNHILLRGQNSKDEPFQSKRCTMDC
jgi:inosine-uridine nucleoside N-ribohydrolase